MSLNRKKLMLIIILITFFSVKVISLSISYLSQNNSNNNLESKKESQEEEKAINKVFVDIEGAVLNPGMYEVNEEIRLGEVIELAGGLTHANKECINLAAKISD